MESTRTPDPVKVFISGPGHHERAARATSVISSISALGLEVTVATDLRPRLADDVRALLEAGASKVRLEADGIVGDFEAARGDTDRFGQDDAGHGRHPVPVVVILRPGPHRDPVVEGVGDIADSVRDAIGAD